MATVRLKNIEPEIKEDTSEIIQRIKNRVREWESYYSKNIENYRNDVKFVYDENGQWTSAEITEYDNDEKKPRLTFNMIPRMLQQIMGEYSQIEPSVKVRAIYPEKTDQEAVNLREGILRTVAFKSGSQDVYANATSAAITGGYGAFRIMSELETPLSFNFVPRYQRINDPTHCGWDTRARELTKSDGDYCYVYHMMSKRELELKYPKQVDFQSFPLDNIDGFWETDDDILVVDYYEKKRFNRSISLLSNGMVVDADEADKMVRKINKESRVAAQLQQIAAPEKIEILKTEKRQDFIIHFYRVIQHAVLEDSKWDSKHLPIIFQPGIIKWYEGREYTFSLTRWLKSTQKAYNFARNEANYRSKLTRYEPYLVETGNIEGKELQKIWNNAVSAKSALPFKPTSSGFTPQRQSPQEVPQSLTMEIERSYNEFQRISGRFDANIGAPGAEVSGVAIQARQMPGNVTIQPFFDNSLTAIEAGANSVLDLMKNIMDNERSVLLTNEDGKQSIEQINTQGGAVNNLSDGEYLVEISGGASFALQKEKSLKQLMQLIQINPQIAQVSPDQLVELTDIQKAPKLIKRIQENLIPQIVINETKDPVEKQKLIQDLAPKMQQQQQQAQMEQMNAQLEMQKTKNEMQTNTIKAISDRLDSLANMMNAQTNRMEASSKTALETMKLQAEEDKANADLQKEIIKAESQLGSQPLGIPTQFMNQ